MILLLGARGAIQEANAQPGHPSLKILTCEYVAAALVPGNGSIVKLVHVQAVQAPHHPPIRQPQHQQYGAVSRNQEVPAASTTS